MANFCPNCGKPVGSSDLFCESCGQRLAGTAQGQQNIQQAQPRQAAQQPQWTPPRQAQPQAAQQWNQSQQQWGQQAAYGSAGSGNVRMGVPAPGYSTRINDPEILKAMRKSRNISKLFVPIIVPLPTIGFVLYASVTGEMDPAEAFRNGLFVSAVFLAFALYSFAKERAKHSYEAIVTDKKILNQRKRLTASQRRNNRDDDQIREQYVTYIRRSDGKNDKIVETTPMRFSAWHYLEVGDRFMYHPQLHFPYEKYDKTRETHLFCVSCLKENPITNDRCSKCGVPLLK